MPGITNPAEEYFKDGIWGWASTVWEKLISSGGLLYNALHGWDGSAWRKLPLVWGYSDWWSESLTGAQEGDGNYEADTATVPAGYIYVLQGVALRNNTGARGIIELMVSDNAVWQVLSQVMTPAQWEYAIFTGNIVLKYQDYVRVSQLSCINGDGLTGSAWGYKMKIAE